MKRKIIPILLFCIGILQPTFARAAVKVTLDPLDPAIEHANPWFSIRTGYTRHGIHHDHGHTLDTRVIKAGETTTIPVNLINPLFFYKTNIQLYHPAYLSMGDRAEEMPSIINDVTFGPFDLKSWRAVLDSNKPIAKNGPDIHVQTVVDHIFLFVDHYIHEIDRASKKVNLERYLPLMRTLIAFSKETSAGQSYTSKSIEDLRRKDPAYAARLARTMEGKFKLADSYVAQAQALLKLTPEQRLKLRFHQDHIFKTKVIYHETMDDSDRKKLHQYVEDQFASRNIRNKAVHERALQWKNPETGISYSAQYKQSYTMRVKKTDKYVPCIRFSLSVDLSTSIPVEIPPIWGKKSKMGKGVTAKFCDFDGDKRLQLVGAESW